jgi:hypothetical protein
MAVLNGTGSRIHASMHFLEIGKKYGSSRGHPSLDAPVSGVSEFDSNTDWELQKLLQ